MRWDRIDRLLTEERNKDRENRAFFHNGGATYCSGLCLLYLTLNLGNLVDVRRILQRAEKVTHKKKATLSRQQAACTIAQLQSIQTVTSQPGTKTLTEKKLTLSS